MSTSRYPSSKEAQELRKLIPKKIPFTPLQWLLQGLATFFLIGSLLYLWHIWPSIADVVPTHFGFDGKADAWGSKMTLLSLPGVNIFCYLLITILLFFPKIWNVPYRFTAETVVWTYQQMRSMCIWMNIACTGLFGYLTYAAAQAIADLPWYFFVIALLVMFVPIAFYWHRLHKTLT